MIADIWSVVWKEWHEYLAPGASRGRGIWGMLLILGFFNVLFPLEFGANWVHNPITAIAIDGAYLPLTIVINIIADAFAGERERHTLETLLATRLSDSAIFIGKVGAAVSYGWGASIVGALLSIVVVNLRAAGGGLIFYQPQTALGILVLGLLISTLIASIGCLISLRASSVRQAQQVLGIGLAVIIFIPVFGIQLLPTATRLHLFQFFASADLTTTAGIVLAVLVALDLVLLGIAIARFQRSRLILG